MAKTYLENGIITFQGYIDTYKRLTGYTNAQAAKKLGCSESCFSRMSTSPTEVSSELIFRFWGMYLAEERRRWI